MQEDTNYTLPAVTTNPTNPLDMVPADFQSAMLIRLQNRELLVNEIKSRLKEGIDFLTLPVWKKDKRTSKFAETQSKPFLSKAGAEKITGMLGLIATFPGIEKYQDLSFSGQEFDTLIIICRLITPTGIIVGEGIGARVKQQDWVKANEKTNTPEYRDLNKACKMAMKAAHIDATLRAAGMSEVFTQDEESVQQTPSFQPNKLSDWQLNMLKAEIAKMSQTTKDTYEDWLKQNNKQGIEDLNQADFEVIHPWMQKENG